MRKKPNVICFGNIWHGDDGFGLHVYEGLKALNCWDEQVNLIDAGTAGLAALGYFEQVDKVVIVDAIKSGNRPGTIHRLAFDDFPIPSAEEFSAHNLGVDHLVAFLPIFFEEQTIPEIRLIGVEITDIKLFSNQLSPPVNSAVDKVINIIKHIYLESS